MKLFLISIVSHGQNSLINQLLRSFEKFIKVENYNVIIVITHNIDDPTQIVKIKNVKVVSKLNLTPRGFGANHNHVFEIYNPDFFAIINPDIVLRSLCNIDEICEVLYQNPGIYSPMVFEKNGLIADFRRKDLTLRNLLKRKFFRLREDIKFDWLAGMALLTKGDVFHALGGFDERFFMYVEDCDLCLRARLHSFTIGVIDNLEVVHDAQRNSRRNVRSFLMHITSLVKYWLKK